MPYAHPVPEENDGIPEKGNNLVNKVAGRDPPSQSRAVGESYWPVFSDPDIDIRDEHPSPVRADLVSTNSPR